MRHAPATLHFAHAFRPTPAGAIEWEELPSLAARVRSCAAVRATTAWDATRPAALEAASDSTPFHEAMQGGVAIREVAEPDIFRHFFGA